MADPIQCELTMKSVYRCIPCKYGELCKQIHELKRRASKCFTNPGDAYIAFKKLCSIYDNLVAGRL